MIHELSDLLLLAVFLLSLLTYAASRSLVMLATGNTVCMICALLLSHSVPLTPHVLFGTGTIFFAAALFGIALKYVVYGPREAFNVLKPVLFALTIVLGSMFLLEDARLLSPSFDPGIKVAGARFASLYLAQSLFVFWLQRPSTLSPLIRIPILSIVVHMFDAAIFFPTAYIGERSVGMLTLAALASAASRTAVALIEVPFLAGFFWLKRRGLTPWHETIEGEAA